MCAATIICNQCIVFILKSLPHMVFEAVLMEQHKNGNKCAPYGRTCPTHTSKCVSRRGSRVCEMEALSPETLRSHQKTEKSPHKGTKTSKTQAP